MVTPGAAENWTRPGNHGKVSPTSRVKEPRKRVVVLLRVSGAALAVAILWATFRKVDAALVCQTLVAVGPLALLVPVPELFWLLAETLGWRWGFRVLGRHVTVGALLRVRLSMEAIGTTLPGGVLLCESLAPYLLRRRAGVPMTEGVTGVLARKFLLLASQAGYMLLMFVVGSRALRTSSERIFGMPGFEWLVPVAALVLGLAALGVRLTLHRGAVVARAYGLLRKIPVGRWRAYLDDHKSRFLQTDDDMARFFGTRKRRLSVPALPFLLAWAIESVETWILLRLVGVELDFVTVASFEVVVVLLFRHVMFLLPAGLGAQDAGYVAFLTALGVSNPVSLGAAFVVLKRGKELLWAAVGFAVLFADNRHPFEPPADLATDSIGVSSAS
jgi:glycosyltransferase 2 family protein